MVKYYQCKCALVRAVPDDADQRFNCSTCGELGFEIPADQFKEGFEAGVYFNLDPGTGKRAKPRRRRR
jgi:hypothetical protein